MATKRYQVIRPYVLVKLDTLTGPEVRGFDQNAVLPVEAYQEDIDKLLRKGMIVEWQGSAEATVAGPPDMDPSEAAASAEASQPAPARSATKGVWVAFAQSRSPRDLTDEQLDELTRDKIAEHYLGAAEE